MANMYYHNYGSDLVYALIGYGDLNSENELSDLIKAEKSTLNKLDASNRTPLYHLISECPVDYKELDLKTAKKMTLISKALLLLTHGADPNVKDKQGWTVLHQCAVNGNLPMLQLCIQWGGDVTVMNSAGKRPIDMACLKKHAPVVDYLEVQSGDLKCLCRRSIRDAMGKRTYKRINELPLPPKLKLFVNFDNPYPGFAATVFVPRPWSEEEILSQTVKQKDVKEFFEENASDEFNADKKVDTIGPETSVEELAAMMETLYFWESFKTIEFEDQLARPPRYSMKAIEKDDYGMKEMYHRSRSSKCRQQ